MTFSKPVVKSDLSGLEIADEYKIVHDVQIGSLVFKDASIDEVEKVEAYAKKLSLPKKPRAKKGEKAAKSVGIADPITGKTK